MRIDIAIASDGNVRLFGPAFNSVSLDIGNYLDRTGAFHHCKTSNPVHEVLKGMFGECEIYFKGTNKTIPFNL